MKIYIQPNSAYGYLIAINVVTHACLFLFQVSKCFDYNFGTHEVSPTDPCKANKMPVGDKIDFNSMWPCDAIWWHKSRLLLAEIMAYCLMAPNH